MPASLIGSFIIFLGTGIYTIFIQNSNITKNPYVSWIMLSTIILTGIYYFYVEVFTETDDNLQKKLITQPIYEWIIRIMNQIILLSLWFALEKDPHLFYIAFGILYITYIIWDMLMYDIVDTHTLAWIDLWGLIIATVVCLINIAFTVDPNKINPELHINPISSEVYLYSMGIATGFYIAIILSGIYLIRFNPFKKKYWSRPLIR